ncbi:MAG: prenyltransferase/squalene oxidase repeat-containing protein [Pirellulaceae bacterium]
MMNRAIKRRRFLEQGGVAGLSAIALAMAGVPLSGQRRRGLPDRSIMTMETKSAIKRGLGFLAAQQNEEGSFGSSGYARNAAVCSLAGLAILASGNTPRRGVHGETVDRLLQYILAQASDSGFIAVIDKATQGPMYDHGFATLFLAQVYGMSSRRDIRAVLKKAVQLIIDTQNTEGGWRYQPERKDADLSVTICQVTALRAARDVGIFVPVETIDRSIAYVKRAQNSDGGFMYTLEGGESAFPRTAAGVVSLYNAGIHEGQEIESGLAFLQKNAPRPGEFDQSPHFLYGQYYATQAWWYAGGERWKRWYLSLRDPLVSAQAEDGSWLDKIGVEYATAICCLILQMPNNYLPIFQR